MHPTVRRAHASLLALFPLAAAFSGCATAENPDAPKVIVKDEYVTLEPALGSHMKRRVRLSEARQPGISPAKKEALTVETETQLLPPTAAEMERIISDRPATGP
jgi:hypothetical protein